MILMPHKSYCLLVAGFLAGISGARAVEIDTTPTLLWETRTPPAKPGYPNPERVTDVAFSPDAKVLAASHGGFASTVLIMDPETGEIIQTLDNKPTNGNFGVYAVDFSPDGRFLASGATGGRVTVWETKTYTVAQKQTIFNQDEPVWDVEFSPDGKTLAAGTHKGLTTWSTADWSLLQQTSGKVSPIDIAYSPDGKLLAANNGATVLSADTLELLPQVSNGGDTVVDFTPSGLLLSSPDTEPMVGLWNVGKRTEALSMGSYRGPDQKQTGFTANVVEARFDGKTVARGDRDPTHNNGPGNVTLFRSNHPFRIPVFGSEDDGLDVPPRGFTGRRFLAPTARVATLLNDGKTLVIAKWGQPGTTCLYFWNIENGELIRKLPLPGKRQTHALAIAPDGKTIAHFTGGDVELLNGETGDVTKTLKSTSGAFTLRFLDNGRLLQASSSIYNLQGRRVASGVSNGNSAEVSVADQSHLIAEENDGRVDLWLTSPVRKVKEISLGKTGGHIVPAISPDGQWLVTGYEEERYGSHGVLQIRDLVTDTVTTSILLPKDGYPKSVGNMVFAPDSRVVAIFSNRNVFQMDPATGEIITHWLFSEINVVALTFTPDSKFLLVTAKDGTTRKMPMDFSSTSRKWTAHAGNVEGLTFHPTDDVLITSGEDGVIKAWKF